MYGRKSNLQPVNHTSDAPTTTLPNHVLNVCVLEETTTERNWSTIIIEEMFGRVDVNVTEQPQQNERDHDVIHTLTVVMSYVCLALGGPGNILSAIVWLRRHVTSKNSSTLYLAVLAISDLLFLTSDTLLRGAVPLVFAPSYYWLLYCIITVYMTTGILEPLLVLSFSVERLIAISRPLQVRCMRLYRPIRVYFRPITA